jgi:hypothetical protein
MFINFDSFGFAIKVATKNLWQKWFYAGRRFFYHCNGFHVFHAMVFMVFCNGFAIPSCKIYIVPSFLLWSVAKSTKHIIHLRKMYLSICNLRTSASKLYILFRTIFRCFETGLNNLFKFYELPKQQLSLVWNSNFFLLSTDMQCIHFNFSWLKLTVQWTDCLIDKIFKKFEIITALKSIPKISKL